jgi:hypothetical protein
VIAASCLAGGSTARGAARSIHDGAGYFSAAALQKAEQDIEDIERRYQTKLVIDTFAKLPLLVRAWPALSGPEAAEQVYVEWAHRRANQAGKHGIYVLICRTPQRVRVEAGRDVKEFTTADRERLQALVAGRINQQRDDAGLTAAVGFVRDNLRARLGDGVAPPDGFPWAEVLWILAVLVGFWAGVEFIHVMAIDGGRDAQRSPVGSIPAGLFVAMGEDGIRALLRPDAHAPPAAVATESAAPTQIDPSLAVTLVEGAVSPEEASMPHTSDRDTLLYPSNTGPPTAP